MINFKGLYFRLSIRASLLLSSFLLMFEGFEEFLSVESNRFCPQDVSSGLDSGFLTAESL